jgi:hypothetical protein
VKSSWLRRFCPTSSCPAVSLCMEFGEDTGDVGEADVREVPVLLLGVEGGEEPGLEG